MTFNKMPEFLPRISTQLLFALTLILNAIALPTYANESQNSSQPASPVALVAGSLDYLLAVHPAVGKPNQPRTVFLQFASSGCSVYAISIDTSLMETQNLVVLRTGGAGGICGVPPPPSLVNFNLEFTPTKAGTLTLRSDRGPDTTIQTVSDIASSKFDINGMWFDAATNGSGIAVHHRRATTDVAFGTWFLFNNNGESRWYTLQSANWQQDGSVLEGLLIQVFGRCQTASLAACPALGAVGPSSATNYWVTPALARITFQSSTRARAEVLTFGGVVLFTSELTKLSF